MIFDGQQIFGSYDSCGSSGNKSCSFGFNDPAQDALELCRESLHPVLCGAAQHDAEIHSGAENKSKEPVDYGTPKNLEPANCGAKSGEANLCKTASRKNVAKSGVLLKKSNDE